MRVYDNQSAISIDEFTRDLNLVMTLRKYIKKYVSSPEEVNVRKMLNHVVVIYNCFGATAKELLLYKIKEPDHLSVLIPMMAFLGWDISNINCVSINSSIVQDLMTI